MHADWFRTVFLHVQLDGNTELARVVDVIMAQAMSIYILMIKVNKLIFFFALLSYRNTHESLGELEK